MMGTFDYFIGIMRGYLRKRPVPTLPRTAELHGIGSRKGGINREPSQVLDRPTAPTPLHTRRKRS